jgi:hypothetical protein
VRVKLEEEVLIQKSAGLPRLPGLRKVIGVGREAWSGVNYWRLAAIAASTPI